MAKKPETVFKERIRPKLDAIESAWWVKIQMLALLGIPDFIGCIRGQFIALELKRHKSVKLEKIQTYVLRKIEESGGIVYRVDPQNWEQVYKELKLLEKKLRD